MQHVEPLPESFPWRGAAIVVGAVAAIELVALIGVVTLHFAPVHPSSAATGVGHRVRPAVRVPKVAPPPARPLRPRTHVRVLVLNGNGVSGAASAEAARLRASGYRIEGAKNAPRHDYARSMVLYRPGWIKEARRLAHDTGIRLVAPVDGVRPATLRGSQAVVILGNA